MATFGIVIKSRFFYIIDLDFVFCYNEPINKFDSARYL